jgi:hypothetical protein
MDPVTPECFAVRAVDLQEFGRSSPAAAELLEAVFAGRDDGSAETTSIAGAAAVVLRGSDAGVPELAAGLRRQRVHVYTRDARGRWSTFTPAPSLHSDEGSEPERPAPAAARGAPPAPPPTRSPRVDPEFAELCGPLSAEELELLRASIAERGCREALVVWRETGVLLDGHNRLAICEELKASFRILELSFASRSAARAWMIDNALGRRNLTPERAAYLRGKRHEVEKLAPGRPAQKRCHGVTVSGETAVRIAGHAGVAERTIQRDAAFARAVDRIAETAGPGARVALLSGEVKLTRPQVLAAAERAPRNLDDLRATRRPASRAAPHRRSDATMFELMAQLATALDRAPPAAGDPERFALEIQWARVRRRVRMWLSGSEWIDATRRAAVAEIALLHE